MAAFPDLPLEILYSICCLLPDSDILSSRLTCRQFANLVAPEYCLRFFTYRCVMLNDNGLLSIEKSMNFQESITGRIFKDELKVLELKPDYSSIRPDHLDNEQLGLLLESFLSEANARRLTTSVGKFPNLHTLKLGESHFERLNTCTTCDGLDVYGVRSIIDHCAFHCLITVASLNSHITKLQQLTESQLYAIPGGLENLREDSKYWPVLHNVLHLDIQLMDDPDEQTDDPDEPMDGHGEPTLKQIHQRMSNLSWLSISMASPCRFTALEAMPVFEYLKHLELAHMFLDFPVLCQLLQEYGGRLESIKFSDIHLFKDDGWVKLLKEAGPLRHQCLLTLKDCCDGAEGVRKQFRGCILFDNSYEIDIDAAMIGLCYAEFYE